jgi:uncharacterized protein with HEPN domain
MTAEAKKLLLDALEAGQSIQQRCAGHTLEQYHTDRWFRRTIEREFEIVGEALNRLDRLDPVLAGGITAIRKIVDFRNRIIHGYDAVDDELVWGVVEKHLPQLVQELTALFEIKAPETERHDDTRPPINPDSAS